MRNAAWRLIDTGALSACENMALDESLLHCFDPETCAPLLRLYGWNPPALSLGRFQRADDVLDLDRCQSHGVEIVRRITGGGVIYHADELTYSIVCSPLQIPDPGSIKESFRVLTTFLLDFYRGLALDACYAVDSGLKDVRFGERTPFCFAGKETFDILISGRKIGGNAQRRLKKVIFQHGSIPLVNRVGNGVVFMRERPAGIEDRVASLADMGVTADVAVLKENLIRAFSDCFGVKLLNDHPSQQEWQQAEQLKLEKYQQEFWTLEGEVP